MSSALWFQCSSCCRVFEGPHALKRHCSISHHDPYECYFCKAIFEDDVALAFHYNSAHPLPQHLDSDSDSDYSNAPITPTTPRASKVDVEVQTVPEELHDGAQKSVQTLAINPPSKQEQMASCPRPSLASQMQPLETTTVARPSSSGEVHKSYCHVCEVTFSDAHKLKNYFAGHKGWCPVCHTVQIKKKRQLRKHIAAAHQIPATCCGEIIGGDFEAFISHLKGKEHRRLAEYYCRLCGQGFTMLNMLLEHLTSSHGDAPGYQTMNRRMLPEPSVIPLVNRAQIPATPAPEVVQPPLTAATTPKSKFESQQSARINIAYAPAKPEQISPSSAHKPLAPRPPVLNAVQVAEPLQSETCKLYCYFCEITFPDVYELNKHLSVHTWCPLCRTMQKKNKKALKEHITSMHQGQIPQTCCAKVINGDVDSLIYHLTGKKHERGKTICRLCHQDFKTFEQLNKHLVSSHGDEASDDEALQMYRRTRSQASPSRETGIPETEPSKVSQPSASTSPAVVKSEEIRELYCPNCEVTFADVFQLNWHLTKHKWCPLCPIINCSDHLELKQHLGTRHSVPVPQKCCETKIDSIGTYTLHLTTMEHEKNRYCHFCRKVCGRKKFIRHFKLSHKDNAMSNKAEKLYTRVRPSAIVQSSKQAFPRMKTAQKA